MPQPDVWSLTIGRWRGVPVRVHLFFLLFATFTCYFAWQLATTTATSGDTMAWIATVCLLVLLFSVLWHEVGHAWAARRLGGHVEAIIVGPLGGLEPVRMPKDPQSELLVTLAGPAASLTLCLFLVVGAGVTSLGDFVSLFDPISPGLMLDRIGEGSREQVHAVVRLAVWINWMLALVNLIPAFPFDGGRACLAFVRVLRPDLEIRRATLWVALLAKLFAASLLVAAWFFRHNDNAGVMPTSLALVLLAMFVFFSARMEEEYPEPEEVDSDLFGYDFSQGFTSLERSTRERLPRPGPISRWWRRFQLRRQIRQRAAAAEDERRLDEVLERLHEHGFGGLTPAEKSLLKRVSARYRSREET